MPQGVFIAFEGGEGSGKDTMIDRLKEFYKDYLNVVFTREPGGTKGGELIRSVLLDSKNNLTAESEIKLFLVARRQLISEVIGPALAKGSLVISNRFRLSTVAYQLYGRDRRDLLPYLEDLERELGLSRYVPHYILLDLSPNIGLRRVEARNDGKTRFDEETLGFHLRVREGYLQSTLKGNATVIDASRPLEEVWESVKSKVEALIGPPAH